MPRWRGVAGRHRGGAARPRAVRWPRLSLVGIAPLPAMALVAWSDWQMARTTLENFGALVWPLAWIVQWSVRCTRPIRRSAPPSSPAPILTRGQLYAAHAVSAIALTAQIAWEASEWVDRIAPPGTVWLACAAVLPLVAFLFLGACVRGRVKRWLLTVASRRLRDRRRRADRRAGRRLVRDCHRRVARHGIAARLCAAFQSARTDARTDACRAVPVERPFPSGLTDTTRFAWLGVGLFGLLNGAALRTAHHWERFRGSSPRCWPRSYCRWD